ncbi:MAG: argininosuccinate lyase [Luteitalea sp.]|nr:argininosuccinate lyase [Luteitalea sp.]
MMGGLRSPMAHLFLDESLTRRSRRRAGIGVVRESLAERGPHRQTAAKSGANVHGAGDLVGTHTTEPCRRTIVNTSRVIAVTGALVLMASQLFAQSDEPRDAFHFMTLANKAQIVMLAEQQLIPRAEAQRIAMGIGEIARAEARPGAARPSDYLRFEKQLIEKAGPEASKLHMGRSRNDLGAAMNRLLMRDKALEVLDSLFDARQALLSLAGKHENTIIAAYTHAVQAQPISLAHYLLALSSALERDSQRAREVYHRLNHSPLGAGALGTSGFALDRERLMELVGFEAMLENSYDAISISPADSKAELAAVYAISSLALGRFAQDLVVAYADPTPGLYLSDEMTGRSSIMPQKRNPGPIESLRRTASSVLARSQKIFLMAHNTTMGEVSDVRYYLKDEILEASDEATEMYRILQRILDGLVVNPERTLETVNADYSTMTELADALLRGAGVPFRIGYNFASAITTYGRSNGKTPSQISYAEYSQVYQELNQGARFPLSEAQLREAIDPRTMVANRRGRGGPQSAEVQRMLSEHQSRLASDRGWVAGERQKMARHEANLDAVFLRLVGP